MLKFHPEAGTLLVCDFDTGFVPPEMVKKRPVVVLSPKRKRAHGVCTVVPISTTPPQSVHDVACAIHLENLMPPPFNRPDMWAKSDMLATVSYHRLNLFRTGRDSDGRRQFFSMTLPQEDFRRIQASVLQALGMGELTAYIGDSEKISWVPALP